MVISFLLIGAIQLSGVVGDGLRARAFFDANNVKVGDPLVLTVDFLGAADFSALHPPVLSRQVGRGDWKLDDASAKTDTFRDARRLTYRVRPMREGVLWFPALEFEYAGRDGVRRTVRSNEIPVHAKGGAQVVVEEMDAAEDANALPAPPELVRDLQVSGRGSRVSGDVEFAWRKALSQPTADAFAAFDFPEAKMNEATCAIREGNWARALKTYQKLEWTIGQTPEIERGIVAALALRQDDPAVELPVWRQVLRPVLRFGWKGRVGVVFGGFAALAIVFWLLNRGIRAVACVVLVAGLALPADAQGLFEQMEREMQRMHQQMQESFGNFSFHFGEKERSEPIRIEASVALGKPTVRVGEPFEFIVALEYPKTASVGQIGLTPSENFGLRFTGQAQNLTDGKSANPSNVVKRIAVPARYDVPYEGALSFRVEGQVSGRQSQFGGRFNLTFSNSFRCETRPIRIRVKPLPSAGQPANFAGVIAEGLSLHEYCDLIKVETNDVVTITYRLGASGAYVPVDFLPPGVAFEWGRTTDGDGRKAEIEYRRYFVADGAKATPVLEIPYYDPRTRSYKVAKTGGTPLVYAPSER